MPCASQAGCKTTAFRRTGVLRSVRDLSDTANAGRLNAEEENELDFYLNVARVRISESEGAPITSVTTRSKVWSPGFSRQVMHTSERVPFFEFTVDA